MRSRRRPAAPNPGVVVIRRALRRRRRIVLGGVGAALVYQGVFLVIPLVTGRAVDELVAGATARDLLPHMVVLVGLGTVRAVAGAIRKYHAGALGAAVGADLRGQLYQHLQRMSFSFHDRIGAGQLMSRASTDVTAIEAIT
ncbi:MAG TPA: ABC transporter transmembrane domain-containing protein, partial [Nitriliruptorales bacterium]